MKKLLLMVITAAVFFGGSAAVSWQMKRKAEQKQEAGDEPNAPEVAKAGTTTNPEKTASPHLPAAKHTAPPRDQPASPAEEATQIAAALKERLAAVTARESQLEARKKELELIYHDIRMERSIIQELRKQAHEELELAKQRTPSAKPGTDTLHSSVGQAKQAERGPHK
jgi:hypothetical protein